MKFTDLITGKWTTEKLIAANTQMEAIRDARQGVRQSKNRQWRENCQAVQKAIGQETSITFKG